jgi:hypothetical protein
MAGTVYLSFPYTRVTDYISNMAGTVYLSFPITRVTDYTRVLGKDK